MDFRNPQVAQNSSHSVNIIYNETVEYSFVSHLFAALRREGISVFMDRGGQKTCWTDNDENHAISVVVISKIVEANDPWSHMFIQVIKPRRDNGIPDIDSYYGLDSFNRAWRNRRAEAGILTSHKSRISSNKILTDSELVEEIVTDVYGKLYPAERIGIYSKLLEIENLIYKQPHDVRSIGIWGMSGIGKTTLAKAVFNHMSTDYDASCFIENFDEAFRKDGLHRLLEEKLGNNILKKEFDIKSSYIMRPSYYRDKICDKRILVVLDDVRDSLAADSFLGRLDWFGPGSLIIMTSIDKQVFSFCQINQMYEVQGLNEQEALQLFSQTAFGNDLPEQDDKELSKKVIDYANGNPLALSIYGQELKGKKSEMEATFLGLKKCPPQKIQDVLKKVYSALDDNEKNIVLDIAFFFKGENVNYVVKFLEGCRYLPRIGIDVLVDKCVLTISENTVQMNNLFQDICQIIFSRETESSTRMFEPNSIRYLLEDDDHKASGESSASPKYGLVIEDIESIILDTSNLKFDAKHDAFKNMFNLRFLKIYSSCSKDVHGLNFPKGLDSLPCGLRLLHWENYPLQSLPQDLDLDNLVELSMPYSQLQTLGAGTKNLKMLKRIRLCHSQQLVEFEIPFKAQNIEIIDLQGCKRLQNFPVTSQLQHLRVVNLSGCTEIIGFQGAPPNIEELHLQGTSIREIPISIVSHSPQKVKLDRQKLLNLLENFQDVEHIDLESVTDLVKVSSTNQGFGKLVHLNMRDCSHLTSLPDMVNLESLQVLHLSGCSELKEITGFPRNIRKLYLGGTAIVEVPQLPKNLEFLNAHGCAYLKSVCLDFEKLPRHYTFSNCFNFSSQVISEFLEKGLTRMSSLARAHQQEVIEAPEVIICIPADARQRSSFLLQEGSNVRTILSHSTRKALSGFAMSVAVSFQDDYHNTVGLGIRCICTWEGMFDSVDKIERIYQCWAPREAPKVERDHIFIFYDTQMHPSCSEVEFKFHTVNWENELLGDNCRVIQCDVQVITASTDHDTNSSGLGKTESEELSLRKAPDVLQTAMARLENEFKHLLVENRLPFELEHSSFPAIEADHSVEEGSMASFGAASTKDLILGSNHNSRRNSGKIMVDLINPDVISDLKNIANTMIQVCTMVRKDALDKFLYNHEVEKLSIEDVLRMDWATLNMNIKKWVRVMRHIIQIYLWSEKSLDNQIFGDLKIGLTCFIDIVKAPMMQLLNFGEAVSLSPRKPEKLPRILEMYELASELLPEIDALFSDHPGSSIRTEYMEVMKRLGDCARTTFLEFKSAIAADVSLQPFPGGAVHPLTMYVMNYLTTLTDFNHTLDSLLMEHDDVEDLTIPPSLEVINPVMVEEESTYENSSSPEKFLAMTRHFYSITSVLEANLQEKSKLYKDVSLRHIFLLNNIHYMTRKVLKSELRHIFGDKWNRKHTWKFQQQAIEYERATWLPVLSFLKDDGSGSGSGSGHGSKNLRTRERFQGFNTAFEEVYKVQTGWVISDEGLREDVRTKASMWVIQAYWTFYNRHKYSVSARYIKYTTDDLERLLLDLFAGSPKSLNNSYRRCL